MTTAKPKPMARSWVSSATKTVSQNKAQMVAIMIAQSTGPPRGRRLERSTMRRIMQSPEQQGYVATPVRVGLDDCP
jgi:hypothetical protein